MLAVVYLIFNEGHTASAGDELVRDDLCAEAIRLGRLLAELMPDEPEVLGLLALMLLDRVAPRGAHDAGRRARAARRPGPHALGPRADRGGAGARARAACAAASPGPYQLQAAINAVHADAATAAETDWARSSRSTTAPGRRAEPGRALNRAVAVAEVDGPEAASRSSTRSTSTATTCYHAIRADLLRRLGRAVEAAAAYEAAIARTQNAAERAFLERRLAALRA